MTSTSQTLYSKGHVIIVAKCECLVNYLPYFFADTGTVKPDFMENLKIDMEKQLACKNNVDRNGKYTVYLRWNH